MTMVLLQPLPTVQLIVLFIINNVYLFCLLKLKPFKQKKVQWLKERAEILYNIASFLMIFVSILGSEDLKANTYDKVFGWPVTLLLTVLLVIEVYIAGHEEVRELCSKKKGDKKGKKSKSKKVKKKKTENLKGWRDKDDTRTPALNQST